MHERGQVHEHLPLRIVAEFKARASDLEGLHAEFVERASRSLDDGVQLVSWRSLVLRWSIVVVDQSRAFFSRTEEPGGGATARRLGRDELALPPRVDDDRFRPSHIVARGSDESCFHQSRRRSASCGHRTALDQRIDPVFAARTSMRHGGGARARRRRECTSVVGARTPRRYRIVAEFKQRASWTSKACTPSRGASFPQSRRRVAAGSMT